MNTFWSSLVNGALLSGVIAAFVWIALSCTSRHALNAATRYAIWWTALAVTLLLPSIWIAQRASHGTPSIISLQPDGDNAGRIVWQAPEMPKPRADSAIALPIEIRGGQWLRPLLIVWLVSSLMLVARVFVSYAALFRRSGRAEDAPREFEDCVRRWVDCTSAKRQVRLAFSTEIAAPVATGPFHPTILIPRQLLERVGRQDLDQIGIHEAAHLARCDDYALLIQRLIEAVFVLHPVVRWVTRQIDLEREIACDDIVASSTEHALSFADCLTRTVALCGRVGGSLAAANAADSRSHLSRRIELLVDGSRNGRTKLLRGRCALVAAGLVCGMVLLARTPELFAFSVSPEGPAVIPLVSIAPTPVPRPSFGVELHRTQRPVMIAQEKEPPAPVATAKSPESVSGQLEAAKTQMAARQFDDAIATYRSLLSEATDDRQKGSLWVRIGEAYRYKGDFAQGIEALEQAAAFLPGNGAVLTNLGLLYEAGHDEVRAREYYERAIAVDPNNVLALNNLAYLLTTTGGDLDLALRYALTARQQLPTFVEVTDTIGWVYLKKNMVSSAVNEFRAAVTALPQHANYRYHYALALNEQGDHVGALNECEQALGDNPDAQTENDIRSLMAANGVRDDRLRKPLVTK